MRVILFDLGNTLENRKLEILLPGALKTLESIRAMKDSEGNAPILALASDFGNIPADEAQIRASQQEYYAILERLGIRHFFEPVEKHVILSIEVGFSKPSEDFFQGVIKRLDDKFRFQDMMFITENKQHVKAARALKMNAVHFRGPGEISGDVLKLTDLIPLVEAFLD
jgi:FMN phosphatase YigB (HAD superfamily)